MQEAPPSEAGLITTREPPSGGARAFDAVALGRSVSADMEALFGAARPPGARPLRQRPERLTGSAERRSPPGRIEGRIGSIGAIIAAAFLGLAAGSMLQNAPAKAAKEPVASAPVASVAVPLPALSPAGLAPVPATPAAETPAPPLASVVNIPVAKPAPPAKPRPVRSVRVASSCSPSNSCSRSDVLAADRGLRRAYANAISAGLSRGDLVRFRNDWMDLRDEASANPRRLVAGYRALANELNRAARAARSGASRWNADFDSAGGG